MKTHVMRATTAEGVAERKVDVNERLLIRAGTDLRSYKVQELGSVTVDEIGEGAARVFISEANGSGDYRRLHGGVRLELGDERWTLNELLHFELLPIPPKPKPPPEPLSNVWELERRDGSVVEVELASAVMSGWGYLDDDDPRRWEVDGFASRERSVRLDDPGEEIVRLRRKPLEPEEPVAEGPVAAEVGA